jgi:hypothetical protein
MKWEERRGVFLRERVRVRVRVRARVCVCVGGGETWGHSRVDLVFRDDPHMLHPQRLTGPVDRSHVGRVVAPIKHQCDSICPIGKDRLHPSNPRRPVCER